MNWISVKDRLPEEFDIVLAVASAKWHCGPRGVVREVEYNPKYGYLEDTEYSPFTFGEYQCYFPAEYWMPLPNSPQED